MNNIVFIGMPGSGKSQIGRMVAEEYDKPFVDVDDFIYAATGRDTADHLRELGDEGFLDFESDIIQGIRVEDGVIASSGSVPLRRKGLDHLRKDGFTIWMDIPLDIIKGRISKRSDQSTRIVGAETMTFEEILNWRKRAYKDNHDVRFAIDNEKPKDEVVAELIELLKHHALV